MERNSSEDPSMSGLTAQAMLGKTTFFTPGSKNSLALLKHFLRFTCLFLPWQHAQHVSTRRKPALILINGYSLCRAAFTYIWVSRCCKSSRSLQSIYNVSRAIGMKPIIQKNYYKTWSFRQLYSFTGVVTWEFYFDICWKPYQHAVWVQNIVLLDLLSRRVTR